MTSALTFPAWSVCVNAKIVRAIPPVPEAGQVAAMFGLHDEQTETLYDQFELEIRPGQIVAVTGPSGSGKSVLLREVAAQVAGSSWLRTEELARSDAPPVAVLAGGSLAERLAVLSRCGLAEALPLITPARCLSGGQLLRLALADALHTALRAGRPGLVVADEFASCLDATTAGILCRQVRKLVAGSPVALLLATPRSELIPALRPDRVVVKPLHRPPEVWAAARSAGSPRRAPQAAWPIVPGTIHDYDALSAFHYLAGRPACHKRVYVIRRPALRSGGRWREAGSPDLAAVLVVSPPLLNVRGRNLATGGRYDAKDRSASLALLNVEMECISRVVVDPTYRGCGLAVRLVRHALATARTPLVEALAAMGRIHPFFQQAGMAAFHLPPRPHTRPYVYYLAEAVRPEDRGTGGP